MTWGIDGEERAVDCGVTSDVEFVTPVVRGVLNSRPAHSKTMCDMAGFPDVSFLISCVVILTCVCVSFLVHPQGQSVAVSEASNEKLRVCPQTDHDFYDDFLFRSKIPSRLYVLDFARVN